MTPDEAGDDRSIFDERACNPNAGEAANPKPPTPEWSNSISAERTAT